MCLSVSCSPRSAFASIARGARASCRKAWGEPLFATTLYHISYICHIIWLYIYISFQVCNYIHISILHHIPYVVYTSVCVYIYVYIYILWSHPIYPICALVTHLILFLAGPSRATCPTSYSSWMQRHSVCRLENWGTMGGTKRILLAVHPQMLFTNHWSIAGGRSFCGTQVVQIIKLIVHEPLTVTDGTGDPFHDAGWPLPVLTMAFPLQFSWEEKIPAAFSCW